MRASFSPAVSREESPLDREVRSLSLAVRGVRAIATHLRPDLDALLALWAGERVRKLDGLPTEFLFIPANTQTLFSDVLAVDIGRLEPRADGQGGSQFVRGLHQFSEGMAIKMSAVGGSASMALIRLLPPDEQRIMLALARAISDADSGRNILDTAFSTSSMSDDIGKKNQAKCSTIWHVHRCLSAVLSDSELYEWWSRVFSGEIVKGLERQRARQQAMNTTYLLNGKLAVTPFGASYHTSAMAFKRGAQVVLFSRKVTAMSNKWCLGLVRDNSAQDLVDLRTIFADHLGDFPSPFIHPDGFLIGWMAKSPLRCSESEFNVLRSRLIDRTAQILTSYWTKS